jgi:hypothetical protein
MFRLRVAAGLVGFLALGTVPAFASENGAKIVEQIDAANDLLNEISSKNLCSSTYFSNSTYRADCTAYYNDLSSIVSAWNTKRADKTLTVAYDTTVETDMNTYETDLKTIFADGGYTYTALMVAPPHPFAPLTPVGGPVLTPAGMSSVAPTSIGGSHRLLVITPDSFDSEACEACAEDFQTSAAECNDELPDYPLYFACLDYYSLIELGCIAVHCLTPDYPPCPDD